MGEPSKPSNPNLNMKPFAAFAFLVLCTINLAVGQICPGSDFFPDQRGCCPIVVGSTPFYADAQGCFPNSAGVYRSAGEVCPADRVCVPQCPAGGCAPVRQRLLQRREWLLPQGAGRQPAIL